MSIQNQIGERVNRASNTIRSIVGGRTASEREAEAKKHQNPPTITEKGWNLENLPPEGHRDVGAFAYKLFQDALRERNKLGIPDRFKTYYYFFRGRHTPQQLSGIFNIKRKSKLSIALLHANITRTVANITARAPVAEVTTSDGIEDDSDQILSEKLRTWNNKEEQQVNLAKSVLNMEIYGITIEKAVFDPELRQGRTVPLDPLSFLPAPGNYDDLNDFPYLIHMFTMPVETAEYQYGVEGVEESNEVDQLLGTERREEFSRRGTTSTSTNYPHHFVSSSGVTSDSTHHMRKALIIEMWIRDRSTEMREFSEVVLNPETGEEEEVTIEREVPKYPGGIRVITITNNGNLVLNDQINPNINPAMPLEMVESTYLCRRFPFFHANSYEDTSNIWGYPMCEVVGDINLEIDELWSSITNYLRMAMYPPLILPKDTMINKSKIRYLPRLVIQPTSAASAQGIRWLDMPTPPQWMFEALNQLISFFDRISQIEDADRGANPGQVVAASAIEMLQERGAVLVRAKIRAVDYLIRERGRCFISFYQNFGVDREYVETPKGVMEATGINFMGRQFNYIVESGSTVAKTSSQVKQEAMELYKLQAIDKQALLKQINFPDWKQIVERMGQSKLQEALNVLVQAGLDQDLARQLFNHLVQDQGGPGDETQAQPPGGNVGQAGAPAQQGVPKADQGRAAEQRQREEG